MCQPVGMPVVNKRLQSGVTLLEVILILAIASSIMILSIRIYRQYEQQVYIQQIKYNVDVLFQAMMNYYQAECYGTTDPSTLVYSPGTLASAPTTTSFSLPMSKLAPYLPAKWESKNPYVKDYILQFNPIVMSPVTVNACSKNIIEDPATPCSTTIPVNQAQIVIWKAQISVETQFLTQNQVYAYRAMLASDCSSKTDSSGNIVPCSAQNPAQAQAQAQVDADLIIVAADQAKVSQDQARIEQYQRQLNDMRSCNNPFCNRRKLILQSQLTSAKTALASDTAKLNEDMQTLQDHQAIFANVTAGPYLVWERLPSATGSKTQSSLWQMTPLVKQFTLQYTHDQMYELSTGYTTPSGVTTMKNYMCGG